jgi:hypothetical protein
VIQDSIRIGADEDRVAEAVTSAIERLLIEHDLSARAGEPGQ